MEHAEIYEAMTAKARELFEAYRQTAGQSHEDRELAFAEYAGFLQAQNLFYSLTAPESNTEA